MENFNLSLVGRKYLLPSALPKIKIEYLLISYKKQKTFKIGICANVRFHY